MCMGANCRAGPLGDESVLRGAESGIVGATIAAGLFRLFEPGWAAARRSS